MRPADYLAFTRAPQNLLPLWVMYNSTVRSVESPMSSFRSTTMLAVYTMIHKIHNVVCIPQDGTCCGTLDKHHTSTVEGLASTDKISPLKFITCAKRMVARPMLAPASTTTAGRSLGRNAPRKDA